MDILSNDVLATSRQKGAVDIIGTFRNLHRGDDHSNVQFIKYHAPSGIVPINFDASPDMESVCSLSGVLQLTPLLYPHTVTGRIIGLPTVWFTAMPPDMDFDEFQQRLIGAKVLHDPDEPHDLVAAMLRAAHTGLTDRSNIYLLPDLIKKLPTEDRYDISRVVRHLHLLVQ